MDRNSVYYRQVQLLMQVLPFVAAHDCFAPRSICNTLGTCLMSNYSWIMKDLLMIFVKR